MSEINMFEVAARKKFRFETAVGEITVEDLFTLPLHSPVANRTTLDSIAVALHNKLSTVSTVSFVTSAENEDSDLRVKFDIVMHILNLKKAEKDEREAAVAKKAKKDQILQLIAQKENEQLAGTSLDDLRRMAEEL